MQQQQARTLAGEGYEGVHGGIVALLESARRAAARSVNAIMTATYWEIGRRIVEFEQRGGHRAGYGEALLQNLARDLTGRFGRGFSRQNLQQMRLFYLAWPVAEICQTASGKCLPEAPAQSPTTEQLARAFPLPWSAYVRLLSVKDEQARRFYEGEALRGGWSVRQLDRQIQSQFFERLAASRNKAGLLQKAQAAAQDDVLTPEQTIKDPFILEFLALKNEYSESELEEALIERLTEFLLELGDDFAFVGRQRRLRLDDSWFRVDLLLFHRRLRCLVIVDLKVGRFSHADAGQMHMYLNFAREHWTRPGENPPIGLILCTEKGSAEAHYALDGLPHTVMAAEYRTLLPDTELLASELREVRAALEARGGPEGGDES